MSFTQADASFSDTSTVDDRPIRAPDMAELHDVLAETACSSSAVFPLPLSPQVRQLDRPDWRPSKSCRSHYHDGPYEI